MRCVNRMIKWIIVRCAHVVRILLLVDLVNGCKTTLVQRSAHQILSRLLRLVVCIVWWVIYMRQGIAGGVPRVCIWDFRIHIFLWISHSARFLINGSRWIPQLCLISIRGSDRLIIVIIIGKQGQLLCRLSFLDFHGKGILFSLFHLLGLLLLLLFNGNRGCWLILK
jgi:hypothetical protein